MTGGLPATPWRLAVTATAPEVEALLVRLPEDGPPGVATGSEAAGRQLLRRLRGLRLELTADGGLMAHWGRGSGHRRWPGSWVPADDTDAPYTPLMITASGGDQLALDGWLARTGAGARLDALYLSPGNGGTWPSAAQVRATLLTVAPQTPDSPDRLPDAGAVREPWGRTFDGTLTPDHRDGPLPGHPVGVSFGPGPRTCRETTAPALALHSTEPGAQWAVLWVVHCVDSAEFATDATGAGELRLDVRYGPEHEDVGAPVWNIPHNHPALPGFALPLRAVAGRARLALRGRRVTGTIELTGHHPFTGEPQSYRARLDAREADPTNGNGIRTQTGSPDAQPPPARDLSGEWHGLLGPLRRLDPRVEDGWRLTAPDRAVHRDSSSVLRLFGPPDLAVGLVRPRADHRPGDPPRLAVLHRAATPPTPPEAAALWHDRIELRDLAQRLVADHRYAEARPLLRRALALYRREAAAAGPGQRHSEEISALQILDHQVLCDAALRDHRALLDRLGQAARLRAGLLADGPSGTSLVPYTRELVTGTLLAMLGQAHRLDHWRGMLDTDAERGTQVQTAEPFHQRLVTVLLGRDEPGCALLAAEAGRARAFADLLGRAAHRTPGVKPDGLGRPGRTDWVFGAPPPLNEESLRRLLARHGHPAVAYFLAGDRLVRWTVTAGGDIVPHTRQVAVHRLKQAVDTVRRAGLPGRGAGPRQAREALRWLAELLWPADRKARLPADPDRPVTLVPHGVLSQVPFAALPDRAGRPLVRRHALTVVPALSLLTGLLDRRDGRSAEHRSAPDPPGLLAFVDPEPMPDGLPALPWTRASFPLLAEVYGPGRSTVYSGPAATATRLAETAAHASVLCLATHAAAYGAREGAGAGDPMDSYVALARAAGHDGRLRARDLAGLRIGADLVILSACESGSGQITADGVIGLGRSFLVRGPTSVLLTLAPVREEDSLDLVHRFHQHWLREGRSRAAALRRAQLAWAEMYPEAPWRWAPFALLGLGD